MPSVVQTSMSSALFPHIAMRQHCDHGRRCEAGRSTSHPPPHSEKEGRGTHRTPSTILRMRSKPRFLPDMSRHAAPMQNLVEPFALALRASLSGA